MIVPTVPSGVEQRVLTPCIIPSQDMVGLVGVAGRTGQSQIVRLVVAPEGFRDDVLQVILDGGSLLGGATILTTVLRSSRDELAPSTRRPQRAASTRPSRARPRRRASRSRFWS